MIEEVVEKDIVRVEEEAVAAVVVEKVETEIEIMTEIQAEHNVVEVEAEVEVLIGRVAGQVGLETGEKEEIPSMVVVQEAVEEVVVVLAQLQARVPLSVKII
jgi:hypothetical protein